LIDVVKSPAYSTGVGLVKYGMTRMQSLPVQEEEIVHVPQGTGLGGRISAWFREVF
jgi:hypothetical protein